MHTLDSLLTQQGVPFVELPKGLPRPPYGHPVSPYLIRANKEPAIVLLAQDSYLTPGNYPSIISDFATFDQNTTEALLGRLNLECVTVMSDFLPIYVDQHLLDLDSITIPTGKIGYYLSIAMSDFVQFLGDRLIPTTFSKTRVTHAEAWDTNLYNKKRIEQLVGQDSKIPPFPETARKIIELFQRHDQFNMDELVTVIERDAPIAAQTISCANAVGHGSGNKPIYSVRGAVNRLGINKTMHIAMQSAVQNSFRVSPALSGMLRDACFNSLMSAFGASLVHREQGGESPQSAYLVGLMHNLGELLLMHVLPEQSQRFISLHQMNPHLSRESLSSEVFMISFASATHLLMKAWDMPENMVNSCMALATYNDNGTDLMANNVREWQVSVGDSGIVPISFVPHGWRSMPLFPVAEETIEKRRRELDDFRSQAAEISRKAI